MDLQWVQKLAKKSEQAIIVSLIVMMAIVLVLATVDLGVQIVRSVVEPPFLILDTDDVLLDLFGVFMLVLIGIELLDTIKVYFREQVVHVEVVMLVAMIAVARKVIVLEPEHYDSMKLFGVASIIAALALGYFFIKKAVDHHGVPSRGEEKISNVENA